MAAKTDSPVLIEGETGTGKELAAREIHASSARASRPFVAINCGAIPKDLVESEFFGYRKGAFTGAQASEIGKFQLANHGTLLLDEIGELPFDAQAKLLRVLEEQEFYPVGSTELIKVDVRVISSTNKDLTDMVDQKLFREDLYFRLNVYCISVPPLREKTGRHFVPDGIISALLQYEVRKKFGKDYGWCQRNPYQISMRKERPGIAQCDRTARVIGRRKQPDWKTSICSCKHPPCVLAGN